MHVKIGEPTVKYRSQYVAEVMFMEGDADGDTLWTLELKDLEEAYEIYKFAKAWKALGHNKQSAFRIRKDDEGLVKLPGFDFLFAGSIGMWPIEEATLEFFDEPRLQNFRWYKLFWYDETGLQYNVEIVEE